SSPTRRSSDLRSTFQRLLLWSQARAYLVILLSTGLWISIGSTLHCCAMPCLLLQVAGKRDWPHVLVVLGICRAWKKELTQDKRSSVHKCRWYLSWLCRGPSLPGSHCAVVCFSGWLIEAWPPQKPALSELHPFSFA